MRYSREKHIGNSITILDLQFDRLALMDSKYCFTTKMEIMIGTLTNIDEFKSLATSISVMKEADNLWKHVFTLFIKKAKRQEKPNTRKQHKGM